MTAVANKSAESRRMRNIGIDLMKFPAPFLLQALEPICTHTLQDDATATPRIKSRLANEPLPLNSIMSTMDGNNPTFAIPSHKTPLCSAHHALSSVGIIG